MEDNFERMRKLSVGEKRSIQLFVRPSVRVTVYQSSTARTRRGSMFRPLLIARCPI